MEAAHRYKKWNRQRAHYRVLDSRPLLTPKSDRNVATDFNLVLSAVFKFISAYLLYKVPVISSYIINLPKTYYI